MDEVHYLTERELAKRWRLSPSSLQQQRHRGVSPVPWLKIGRAVRYALPDVLAAERLHPR